MVANRHTYHRQIEVPLVGVALRPLLDGVVIFQVMPGVTASICLHAPPCTVDWFSYFLALCLVVVVVVIAVARTTAPLAVGITIVVERKGCGIGR